MATRGFTRSHVELFINNNQYRRFDKGKFCNTLMLPRVFRRRKDIDTRDCSARPIPAEKQSARLGPGTK